MAMLIAQARPMLSAVHPVMMATFPSNAPMTPSPKIRWQHDSPALVPNASILV
jgi:hypothetical protein